MRTSRKVLQLRHRDQGKLSEKMEHLRQDLRMDMP